MPKYKNLWRFFCCGCGQAKENNNNVVETKNNTDPYLKEYLRDVKDNSDEFLHYEILDQHAKSRKTITLNNNQYNIRLLNPFFYLTLQLPTQSSNKKNASTEEKGGWKLHVSLNHEIENMKKAWQVIQWVASKFDIARLKISPANILDSTQDGEEVCIYLYKNKELMKNPQELTLFLETLEQLLRHEKIVAGEKPLVDVLIKGSNRYLWYRSDKNPDYFIKNLSGAEPYISQKDAKKRAYRNEIVRQHNPCDDTDPLTKITVKLNDLPSDKDEITLGMNT